MRGRRVQGDGLQQMCPVASSDGDESHPVLWHAIVRRVDDAVLQHVVRKKSGKDVEQRLRPVEFVEDDGRAHLLYVFDEYPFGAQRVYDFDGWHDEAIARVEFWTSALDDFPHDAPDTVAGHALARRRERHQKWSLATETSLDVANDVVRQIGYVALKNAGVRKQLGEHSGSFFLQLAARDHGYVRAVVNSYIAKTTS